MAEGMGTIDPAQLVETASAVREQVTELVEQAAERLELERRLRENPWMVLGVAAGAGFLLGGGLWPALRPIVKAVGRAALSPSNLLAIAAAVGAMRAASTDEETPGPEAMPTEH